MQRVLERKVDWPEWKREKYFAEYVNYSDTDSGLPIFHMVQGIKNGLSAFPFAGSLTLDSSFQW